ncbi:hypothetical protein [Amycolatopsis japonica]
MSNVLLRNLEGFDGVVHAPNGDGKYPGCLPHDAVYRKSDWTPTKLPVEGCSDCARLNSDPRRVTHIRLLELATLLAQRPQGRTGRAWWRWIQSVIRGHRNGELELADAATWSGAVHQAVVELAASVPISGAGELFVLAYTRETQ